MGNSNKHIKEKNSNEKLNNSAIFGKHKDFIKNIDSNNSMNSEILNINNNKFYENLDSKSSMKSEVLNIDNKFHEHLDSNEDLIKSTLSLSEDDNFLGEYHDDFKSIKLIKKDLIYNIYKAENIKDNRKVSLKVYNKKKLEQGDYDFFLAQIKGKKKSLNYVNALIL